MQVAALTGGSGGRLPEVARSDASGATAPAATELPRESYLSPVIRFDKQARVLVFQFRDSETGNVTQQYPSEKVVKLYRDNAPKDVPVTPATPRGGQEVPDLAGARASGGAEAAPKPAATSGGSTENLAASEATPNTGGSGGTDRVSLTA